MKKKTPRRRIDVNVEELDRVIDSAQLGPLSEADCEKTSAVPGDQTAPAPEAPQPETSGQSKPKG